MSSAAGLAAGAPAATSGPSSARAGDCPRWWVRRLGGDGGPGARTPPQSQHQLESPRHPTPNHINPLLGQSSGCPSHWHCLCYQCECITLSANHGSGRCTGNLKRSRLVVRTNLTAGWYWQLKTRSTSVCQLNKYTCQPEVMSNTRPLALRLGVRDRLGVTGRHSGCHSESEWQSESLKMCR